MFAVEIWLAFNQSIKVLIELLSVLLKNGVYISNSSLLAPSQSQPDPRGSKIGPLGTLMRMDGTGSSQLTTLVHQLQ